MIEQIQNPKSKIHNCLIGLALCVALVACAPSSAVAQQKAAPELSAAQEVVIAGKPVRKTLTLITTQPARIESLQRTPVHSKLAAYVAEVLVDYGDRVKKDQPLIKLKAPEIDADINQKRSLLEQAKAEYAQAIAGAKAADSAVVTARSKVAQAEAATARVQADIDRWQSEFTRIQQLANSGSVNRQLVDETQQKYRAAEASLKEALAAIDAAKATESQAQSEASRATADVDAAKARIRVAEANVSQSEAVQSYLTITAPFDGVVSDRKVDPGHFVQPASSISWPLLIVTQADKMRVFVAVPEMEAAQVDLGDAVSVEIQSLRGAEVKGKVTRTGFALDPGSRSLETIIDLDNRDGQLRPGLYATARIVLAERPGAVTLPTAAVVRQEKEAHCYRLVNGKAAKTPIQLGIKVGDDWEVVSGLSESDIVILNKAAALKDGQPVDVLKPQAKK